MRVLCWASRLLSGHINKCSWLLQYWPQSLGQRHLTWLFSAAHRSLEQLLYIAFNLPSLMRLFSLSSSLLLNNNFVILTDAPRVNSFDVSTPNDWLMTTSTSDNRQPRINVKCTPVRTGRQSPINTTVSLHLRSRKNDFRCCRRRRFDCIASTLLLTCLVRFDQSWWRHWVRCKVNIKSNPCLHADCVYADFAGCRSLIGHIPISVYSNFKLIFFFVRAHLRQAASLIIDYLRREPIQSVFLRKRDAWKMNYWASPSFRSARFISNLWLWCSGSKLDGLFFNAACFSFFLFFKST